MMRRVYLAHCLSAHLREDIDANRAAAAAAWGAFVSKFFKVAVSADWIWLSGVLSETQENREWGLACDKAQIERCDELWMVGPRVSGGMTIEGQHARAHGIPVFDLTGLPPNESRVTMALVSQGWRP